MHFEQQVNVIPHESIRIKLNSVSALAFEEVREVSRPILVIKEDVLPLVSPRDDMVQRARKMNTWFASHEPRLSPKCTLCRYFITIARPPFNVPYFTHSSSIMVIAFTTSL